MMVKRRWMAGMLALFLAIRLFPAVSSFWADRVSLPLLRGMAAMGDRVPFALLEYLPGVVCLILPVGLFRRRLARTLLCLVCAVPAVCLVIWYPLYFLPQPAYTAQPREIAAVCNRLIDELNASDLHFSEARDLPAKFIRHPGWMDALNISGLCSFITGEALISPDLEAASRPFVAVHERMHLEGHAVEGAANIAAWNECMAHGGDYAASARLWALRYGMGLLRRIEPTLYDETLPRMNHALLQCYRGVGGAYSPAPPGEFMRRVYVALGIETAVQNYEILCLYLAAEMAQ